MEYTGQWGANNDSTYNNGYLGNNKKKLAQNMRAICEGNIYSGNSGNWAVSDDNDIEVLAGTIIKGRKS